MGNAYITPIVLLVLSNVFMTFAWYGHLAHKSKPLLIVIIISWGIAFLNIALRSRPTGWGMRYIQRLN